MISNSEINSEVVSADPNFCSAYEQHFTQSLGLFQQAQNLIAGGTVHDSQRLEPFPVYIQKAKGSLKWDADGHQIIDYWMGHGSLLFGHCFPPVLEAVIQQINRGSHYGGSHESEVRWAELVCKLIPSAERIRFTSSGSEATLLAMRVARAFTGRELIVKLDANFHGWHDEAMSHFVSPELAGLNPGSVKNVLLASPFFIESVVELVKEENVAAVILEPGGGGSGSLPWSSSFLKELRENTYKHGSLLIFDEVVSGFRYSPGGVQKLCNVIPDITTLAKILAGGLPGGAVVGRADVMSVFGSGIQLGDRLVRVPHTGTFNGNPLSASAGIAMLEHITDGVAQYKAQTSAEQLANSVNKAAEANQVDVYLYTNNTSIYHILIGAHASGASLEASDAVVTLYASHKDRYETLRRALLVEGIDTHPIHGWVSAVHDNEIINLTTQAFDRVFQRLGKNPDFAL